MKKITYRERIPIDRYRVTDHQHTVMLYRTWTEGGLLYGYRDRYNVMVIAMEDIIRIEDK